MTRHINNLQPVQIDRDLLVQSADALWLLHRFVRHTESIAESICFLLEHGEKRKAIRLAEALAQIAEQATNHDAATLSADIFEALPIQKGGAA